MPVLLHPIQLLFLSSLLLVSNPLLCSWWSWGMGSIGIRPSIAPCTAILCRLVRPCNHCHSLTVRVVGRFQCIRERIDLRLWLARQLNMRRSELWVTVVYSSSSPPPGGCHSDCP